MDIARLHLEHTDGVARITIDHPTRHNAITSGMWSTLAAITEQVDADEGVKIVLVCGKGTVFSSGADIAELFDTMTSDGAALEYMMGMETAVDRLAACGKPTIAIVRGDCFGAGCTIATACDLRFADHTARFAITPAKLGLTFSVASTKRIVDLVGPAKAKDLLYSARFVAAQEAHEIGLIDRLLDADALEDDAYRYATAVCRLSSYSHRTNKRNIEIASSGSAAETEETREAFVGAFAGRDFSDGVAAFRAKRQPRFSDR